MKRFVEGDDRKQVALLPECVDDYIGQDNPIRIVDVFVDELDLTTLGFNGTTPAITGRPSYHPGVMLKIYIYGYLNRVPSSRRLERECQRNVELMWLAGRLAPDFKTIVDFRRDNGPAIRNVCRRFVELCRGLKLLSGDMVAIDGSKFKAVNSRDRNFTAGKIDKRQQQIEESVQRYLDMIETADRTSPTGFDVKTVRLYEKIALLRQRKSRKPLRRCAPTVQLRAKYLSAFTRNAGPPSAKYAHVHRRRVLARPRGLDRNVVRPQSPTLEDLWWNLVDVGSYLGRRQRR
ncbi:transposase [Paraburkholderia sp. RAU2J]|nr:transposase [Paraburkholderia sp. RAU2J]